MSLLSNPPPPLRVHCAMNNVVWLWYSVVDNVLIQKQSCREKWLLIHFCVFQRVAEVANPGSLFLMGEFNFGNSNENLNLFRSNLKTRELSCSRSSYVGENSKSAEPILPPNWIPKLRRNCATHRCKVVVWWLGSGLGSGRFRVWISKLGWPLRWSEHGIAPRALELPPAGDG